jgi:DNA-binding response OmpR family regulator
MQDKRILIIDDDHALLDLLETVLAPRGAEVCVAASGQQGLDQFHARRPDLVLLDVMMPDMDGWEVCRQIRLVSDVPIIMLTAQCRDEDIVRGLKMGADDYVTKPFSPEVLLARSQAALRRPVFAPERQQPFTYHDGHLTINLEQRRVLVKGEPVKLSVTEYELLAYLVRRAGRVLTFRQILRNVWDEVSMERTEYVHNYVSYLRYKLEPDPRCPVYFLSDRGVGYRFVEQGSQSEARSKGAHVAMDLTEGAAFVS